MLSFSCYNTAAQEYLPIRGTASLVIGINSETMFMKTVKDSITVTPEI